MPVDLDRDLLPPPYLIKDGSPTLGAYISTGAHFRSLFETFLPLRPDMRVFEVGSCVGRISRQFIPLLSDQGTYTGLEVMRPQVEWCTSAITARFPNFRFLHADVRNTEYNPDGATKASDYTFPLEDESQDLVLLTSVFTHMLRRDMIRYLEEIRRVLRPGALCFATFYLYTREEFPRIFDEQTQPRFLYPVFSEGEVPVVMCADSEDLEEAVAYEKEYVLKLIADSGLALSRELPGSWLERDGDTFSRQDSLILVRRL